MRRTIVSTFGPSALATPANAVSLLRMLAMPVLLTMILEGEASWPASAFWCLLACSDGFDGWLARRQGTTRSGAFLDPLADKIIVLAAMLALVATGAFWWLPVSVIATREAGLVLYRASAARRGASIPARPSAKVKTVVQDLAVGAALLPPLEAHAWVAHMLLWLAVALTVFTGAQYLQDGRQVARAV